MIRGGMKWYQTTQSRISVENKSKDEDEDEELRRQYGPPLRGVGWSIYHTPTP